HRAGVITINAAEADDLFREAMRIEMGEPVRTLLGHFRHESGHYYFDLLLDDAQKEDARALFGDERADYDRALAEYYQGGPATGWEKRFISPYASAHPFEDWAECWSHYLQARAVLDVAEHHKVLGSALSSDWASDAREIFLTLNDFCRRIGRQDAYPYLWPKPVLEKLEFIHRVIDS
ncbi:MAG: putative zinc-binding metallopeptidase, partial [Myxococcales bacterium]|nr:putative zinc-binding metallopeptidase [Myxococcales bacterium]